MEKIDTMKPYDIIYDTLMLDNELYTYHTSHNIRELMDGDDGYTCFLVDKVNDFEKRCDEYYFSEENYGKFSGYDAIADFVEKNIERWERELRGENLYKVKVVLEFDVESADSLNNVVGNVKELFYDKSVADYGCDAIKDVRVVNAVGKEVNE